MMMTRELEKGIFGMSDNYQTRIDLIRNKVNYSQYGISNKFVDSRFEILYINILEEALDNPDVFDVDKLTNEIIELEKLVLPSTKVDCEQFEKITYDEIVSIFSDISYTLAVQKVRGNELATISLLLSDVYEGLVPIISQTGRNSLIGDTRLDFEYANGESRYISLRLKRYMDRFSLMND